MAWTILTVISPWPFPFETCHLYGFSSSASSPSAAKEVTSTCCNWIQNQLCDPGLNNYIILYTIIIVVMGYENGKTHWATKWAMGCHGYNWLQNCVTSWMQPRGLLDLARFFTLEVGLGHCLLCRGNTAWLRDKIKNMILDDIGWY